MAAMSATFPQEMELIEKHEEILWRRTELLRQMEPGRQQMNIQRRQHVKESVEARCRNAALLQDLQKIENCLRGRQLQQPHLLVLETKYWASVEESIPAWEHFLLGKGPHPTDSHGHPPRRTKQKVSTAKIQGLPPLPKPRNTR